MRRRTATSNDPDTTDSIARNDIMPTIYQFDLSFEDNARQGPRFDGPWPRVPEVPGKTFLGLPVNSRYGIAAGPGINSRWLECYGRLGFDILTYKTVRLVERLAHPAPNFTYLEADASAAAEAALGIGAAGSALPPEVAWTGGSIGTPSSAPAFWQEDIAVAKAGLGSGQVLIVSVMGTASSGMSRDAFANEFETLAGMAREAGADVVEGNLSCPNVTAEEGQVYLDTALSAQIAQALRRGAGGLPTLLKVGHLGPEMSAFLRAVAPHASGVVMANALARPILDRSGAPYFGSSRRMAGVHGAGIHHLSLDCVREARAIIDRERLGLEVVGVGGASTPERAAAFIEAGACAALVASSAFIAPFSACVLKEQRPDI